MGHFDGLSGQDLAARALSSTARERLHDPGMVRGAVLTVAIVVAAVGFGRAGTASPPATGSAVAISAGLAHTCALTVARGVKCWGSNSHDELGDGTKTNSLVPVAVS